MAEALSGGRLTPGVVRIGDTVRRPVSPFAARLLSHLDRAGFDGAPRYLGPDTLTFLPGDVPGKWRAFDDDQVAAAGALMRRMHDASRPLAESLGGGTVVCHHDPGPNNTVFRSGRPVAFIDFEFAAVGDPLEDLGYMAWSWCISSKPSRGPAAAQARQVRVLADGYGLEADQRRGLPAAIVQRLERNERFWNDRAANGPPVVAGPGPAEILTWTLRERTFVERFEEVFAAACR